MSAQPAKSGLGLKIVLVLLVLAGAGAFAFYRFRAVAIVVEVRRDKAADLVTGSVVVHADKDAQDIKSDMGGRIAWIDPRQLGTPFKKGEPILRLDSSELKKQKDEAAAGWKVAQERRELAKQADPGLVFAQEKLDQARREFERGGLSKSQWDEAQLAFTKFKTDRDLSDFDLKRGQADFEKNQAAAQEVIERMTIRAPMDCVLKDIPVAIGALIGNGTTVATYYSQERVVIAKVGEEEIGKVKVGQLSRVRLQNLGQIFDAKVSWILPFADPDTQRYSVYLNVNTSVENLAPYATGETTITVAEHENQPVIPRRALLPGDFVLVVKGGIVEKRKITIGFRSLSLLEVPENLAVGEKVIVEDLDQFRDGQHVSVEVVQN